MAENEEKKKVIIVLQKIIQNNDKEKKKLKRNIDNLNGENKFLKNKVENEIQFSTKQYSNNIEMNSDISNDLLDLNAYELKQDSNKEIESKSQIPIHNDNQPQYENFELNLNKKENLSIKSKQPIISDTRNVKRYRNYNELLNKERNTDEKNINRKEASISYSSDESEEIKSKLTIRETNEKLKNYKKNMDESEELIKPNTHILSKDDFDGISFYRIGDSNK